MLLILKWTSTDWWTPVKGKRRRFIYLKANNVIENVLVEDILKIRLLEINMTNGLFIFVLIFINLIHETLQFWKCWVMMHCYLYAPDGMLISNLDV